MLFQILIPLFLMVSVSKAFNFSSAQFLYFEPYVLHKYHKGPFTLARIFAAKLVAIFAAISSVISRRFQIAHVNYW